MKKEVLRKDIIRRIRQLKNSKVLADLNDLLNLENSEILELTDEQLQAVRDGLTDIKEGRTFTSAQVNEEFLKWQKK